MKEKKEKPQQKFCKCEKPQKNIRFDYCEICSKYLPPHPESIKDKIIDLLIGVSIIGHRYQKREDYEKLANEIIEQVRED